MFITNHGANNGIELDGEIWLFLIENLWRKWHLADIM